MWSDPPQQELTLCLHSGNPFGEYLQHLRQKKINKYISAIKNTQNVFELTSCNIVFISRAAIGNLNDIIEQLNGMPILTIADSPGMGREGVILNMSISEEGKITFEANIAAAKKNGLKLSSQLLRFASEVYQ